MTDGIKKQYENWIYPRPVFDLDAYCRQSFHYHDLKELKSFIENYIGSRQISDVLIAGCGTNQAATHAYRNPEIQYTAIDVSSASLAHQKSLVAKYDLSNLNLIHLDIRDAHQLDKRFDHIISTGVVHHFSNPKEPLQVLESLLKKGGLLNLMVYGKTMRTGVYMLQEAFSKLKLDQGQADVDLVRTVLERHLDKDHPATAYVERATEDLQYDGGIVDTFLNPIDNAYSVLEVHELLDSCDLELASWITPWIYEPLYFFSQNSTLLEKFRRLTKPQQHHVTDLLISKIGAHRFLAKRKDHQNESQQSKPGFIDAPDRLMLHPLCLLRETNQGFIDIVSDKTTLGSLPYEIGHLLQKNWINLAIKV